jgi:dTDP-4-dehydrorhamnose reductase
VLVLGAEGMLGHMASLWFESKDYEVTRLDQKFFFTKPGVELDATNISELSKFLFEHDFDLIVNCIGLLVNTSEQNHQLAIYLNSYLPQWLEFRYRGSNCRIFHISSDTVFSGDDPPYKENSPYSNQTFYGRTKALGEIINDKDLTFRASMIGPELNPNGTSLFNWFISQKEQVMGYSQVWWTGVTSLVMAQALEQAYLQNLTGLYHLVPSNPITKYELFELLDQTFDRNLQVISDSTKVDGKILVNTRSDFSFRIPDYPQMLLELREWILNHPDLYQAELS